MSVIISPVSLDIEALATECPLMRMARATARESGLTEVVATHSVGKASVTIRVRFQAPDHRLGDPEITWTARVRRAIKQARRGRKP